MFNKDFKLDYDIPAVQMQEPQVSQMQDMQADNQSMQQPLSGGVTVPQPMTTGGQNLNAQ